MIKLLIYINLSLWYISIKKLSKEIFLKIFPQRDYIIISKTVFVQDNNNIIVPLLGTHKYFFPHKIRLTELFYS